MGTSARSRLLLPADMRLLLLCALALGCSAFAPLPSKQQLRPTGRAAAASSIQMLRVCDITGKKANNANRVTFSNKHNAYWQYPNLQTKKFFSPKLDRTVKLKARLHTPRPPLRPLAHGGPTLAPRR